MLKKRPMYWKCQLIGWMIYSITLYLFGLAAKIDQTSLIQAIIQYALIGFLLTHLMKTILLKMIATNKSFKTQVFYFFSVTLLFSILATILFRLTELGLSLYELDVDMDAKSIFFVRTLLAFSTFLTWNLIYFSYHYIEKNRKEQIEKIRFEKELQIQKLKSEKTQAEMRQQATELQIEAIVATQEQERKRISRDLHDDVGTKLSALNLYLYSLSEKATLTNNEEIKSLAQGSRQFIKETMQDVRELLLNLSPTVLEEFGYTTAIEGLVTKINETKQINFDLV